MTETTATHRPLRRLVSQSGLYALGNMALKAGGLILAPLYLNHTLFSEKAYGQLVLLDITLQVSFVVINLGLAMGMLKLMSDPAYAAQRERIPVTALVATLGTILLGGILLWIGAPFLAGFMLDDATYTMPIYLLIFHIGFKVLGAIPYMVLRIRERAGLFAFSITLEMALLVAGVYYFLAVRELGLTGVMIAYVISSGSAALVLLGVMLRQVTWEVEWKMVRPLVQFGAPLALAGLAATFLNVGDQYLLKWFTNSETVAVYGWGTRLSSVLRLLFVSSFQMAFSVIGLKTISQSSEGGRLFRRTFRHYVIWTGWAVLGVALLAYDVTALLSRNNPNYLTADALVLPITLGYLAYGLYFLVVNVLYATGKTKSIAGLVLLSALLNGILNWFVIPKYGALGAALTTLLSFAFLMLLTTILAEKSRRIQYPWRVLVVVLMLIGILYALAQGTLTWSMEARLSARLGLILSYWAGILAFKLYTGKEIKAGWIWSKGRWVTFRRGEDKSSL